jgi:hypothetical protein
MDIFVMWLGGKMTSVRKRCLNSIYNNSGVSINYITSDNVHYFVPDFKQPYN